MEIYNFLLGLAVWAGVGIILSTLIYAIAYCASKIWGFKLRKPFNLFLLIILGCELSYILQVIARKFVFAQNLQQYQTLFLVINTLAIIVFFVLIAKKYYKKGKK